MRPLPPYTVRPLKRQDVRRTAATAVIRETAEALSQSVRSGRPAVKQEAERERPRLRVLQREI